MPVRNWRKNCLRCNKSFLTYLEDMVYCNTDCEGKHAYEKHFRIKKDLGGVECLQCGLMLSGARKFCDSTCSNRYKHLEVKKQKDIESNIKEGSEFKVSSSRYKTQEKLEYKRMYEDFYIRRQINGKARDLI